MRWLWVPGVFLTLLILLCLTRVGARLVLADGGLAAVNVKVGLFCFRVFPRKTKVKKAKAEEKKKTKGGKEKKPLPRITAADVRDAIRTLWPPLKRALIHFGRGIRIHPMDIGLIVGGRDDPAAAAELYGALNAGMWTAMPLVEQWMDIPDPHIHMELDFEVPGMVPEGEAGISIRVGTLIAMAFGVGFPALRWFLRLRKRAKQHTVPQPEQAGA